jgi:hypothetical protein
MFITRGGGWMEETHEEGRRMEVLYLVIYITRVQTHRRYIYNERGRRI